MYKNCFIKLFKVQYALKSTKKNLISLLIFFVFSKSFTKIILKSNLLLVKVIQKLVFDNFKFKPNYLENFLPQACA